MCLRAGIAATENVNRVARSNVRMPRSHRMTCLLPHASTYSAASRNSSSVALMPRFRRTGLAAPPTAASRAKFCIFRVPTWSTSAYRATSGTCSGATTSVTMARPVASRASARNSRPCSARPWKAYGSVRGLNAPPRRPTAPASRTAAAISRRLARSSTAHGPAMSATRSAPTLPVPRGMTVGSGRASREAILYRARTGMTFSTPGATASRSADFNRSSPTHATTVRSVPWMTCGARPISSTRSITCRTCSGVALGCMTTIMGVPPCRSGLAGPDAP